jgi:hypothetical protein
MYEMAFGWVQTGVSGRRNGHSVWTYESAGLYNYTALGRI